MVAGVIVPLAVGVLSVVGSIWAFSSSLATKADAKDIAQSVVINHNQSVVQRLSSLEAKVDILLERRGRGE